MNQLPKDLIRHFLVCYVTPEDWISCLKAGRIFHVLLPRQQDEKYEHFARRHGLARLRKWHAWHQWQYVRTKVSMMHVFWWKGEWQHVENIAACGDYYHRPGAHKLMCPKCGKPVRRSIFMEHLEACSTMLRKCCKCGNFETTTGWKWMRHQVVKHPL